MTDALIQAILTPIVDSGIKALSSRITKSSTDKGNIEEVEAKIQEYYKNSFLKWSIAHTILINSSQRFLSDIYIPLTIQSKSNYETSIVIDRFPKNEFSDLKYILIEDSAGMGKSTISKVMYLDLLTKSNLQPILIELRKIKKEVSLVEVIANEIFNSEEGKFLSAVKNLLMDKNTVVFLDGYDEIAIDIKEHVTKEISKNCITNGLHSVILTSRAEDGLLAFSQFQRFRIKEFTNDQAFSLIKRFDPYNRIADSLINEINNQKYIDIRDYLKNPLLTTLLFNVYDIKREIPLKKHLFYREIYLTLFERHDLSKEHFKRKKHSNLDIEDFQLVLKYLGYHSFKISKVEYDEEELIMILYAIIDKCLIKFNVYDLIKDLTESVPLFIKDGQSIRWIHKSLIEYFTALYIFNVTKDKSKVFNIISQKSNPINVMDIFYDLDLKSFEEIFVEPLVQSYFKYKDLIITNFPHFSSERVILLSEHFFANILVFVKDLKEIELHNDGALNTANYRVPIEEFNNIEPKRLLVGLSADLVVENNIYSNIRLLYSEQYIVNEVLIGKNHSLFTRVYSKYDETTLFNLPINSTAISELLKVDESQFEDVLQSIIMVLGGIGYRESVLVISNAEAEKYLERFHSRQTSNSLFD